MNKIFLYFCQSLHLIREERLFSSIYVGGTALAVAFTMVIVMAYNFRLAPVYPEVNRMRTCYLDGIVAVSRTSGQVLESASVSQMVVDKLSELECVGATGLFLNYQPDFYVQKPDGNDEPVYVRYVNDGFFKVYQFDFIEGRPFTYGEWKTNQRRIVLTDALARRVFGKAEGLVGHTISIDYGNYTICGIVRAANVVSAMSYAEAYIGGSESPGYWELPWGRGINKVFVLTDDVDVLREEFREMCSKISHEFEARGEEWEIKPKNNGFTTHQEMAMGTDFYTYDAHSNLIYLVLTFVALLIVPVVNLSGIISGRMESRLAEMGVRKAFGGSRTELLNQILAENFVLTFIGSLLGLLLAWGIVQFGGLWVLDALGFSHSTDASMEDFIPTGEMLFSPLVFVATLLFCLLINTFAAILPAWLSLKKPIVESMNQKR